MLVRSSPWLSWDFPKVLPGPKEGRRSSTDRLRPEPVPGRPRHVLFAGFILDARDRYPAQVKARAGDVQLHVVEPTQPL